MVMTPEQYHTAAMRTAAGPEVFHYPTPEQDPEGFVDNEFLIDMVEYLRAAAKLDDWKSRLFYGKPKYYRAELDATLLSEDMAPQLPDFDRFLDPDMSISNWLHPQMIHSVLGIATEGAELVDDMMKLMKAEGQREDEVTVHANMIRETGDVEWYQELLALYLRTSTQEARQVNIDRLKKRFPEKFSASDALARADEVIHSSDCAVHNEPSYPNGPCDCGAGSNDPVGMTYSCHKCGEVFKSTEDHHCMV